MMTQDEINEKFLRKGFEKIVDCPSLLTYCRKVAEGREMLQFWRHSGHVVTHVEGFSGRRYGDVSLVIDEALAGLIYAQTKLINAERVA